MGISCGRDFSLSSAEALNTPSGIKEIFEMYVLVFMPPGEHDVRSGGERYAGREGRQEGVHRLVDQDADHRRGQEDHPY